MQSVFSGMASFNVYLDGELIDTVYYSAQTNPQNVKDDLVDHDGYNANIIVVKEAITRS